MSYVFTNYGTCIGWKASIQKVVTLLTTEVEYIVMTEVVKQIFWLKGLAKELKVQH